MSTVTSTQTSAEQRAREAFEAILERLPGLRHLRTINAATLRRKLNRADGTCTVCATPVPRGRKGWCSESCVKEFNGRTSGWAWFVRHRDKGVCSLCGIDTKLYHDLPAYFSSRHLWRFSSLNGLSARHKRPVRACTCFFCVAAREAEEIARWEADHIVPVWEGGGLCGPENLRTLCLGCHKAESARGAARRAKARRSMK